MEAVRPSAKAVLPTGSARPAALPGLSGSLTAGAIWSIIGGGLGRGATLVAFLVIARLVGRSEFGIIGLVYSTTALFASYTGLGFGWAAIRAVARQQLSSPSSLPSSMVAALTFTTALSSAAACVYYTCAPLIAHFVGHRDSALAVLLRLSTTLIVMTSLAGTLNGFLTGLKAFKSSAIVSATAGIMSLAVVSALTANYGIAGAISGLTIGSSVLCITAIGALVFELRKVSRRLTIERSSFWVALRESTKVSGSVFVSTAVWGTSVWISTALLSRTVDGYSELGLYTAADRYRNLLIFVPATVMNSFLPSLMHAHSAGNAAAFNRLVKTSFAVNVGICAVPALVLMVFADRAMAIFGRDFRQGSMILTLLCAAAVANAAYSSISQAIYAADHIWLRTAVDLSLSTSLVLLSMWLVPKLGAVGAALALLLAYGLGAAAAAGATKRIVCANDIWCTE